MTPVDSSAQILDESGLLARTSAGANHPSIAAGPISDYGGRLGPGLPPVDRDGVGFLLRGLYRWRWPALALFTLINIGGYVSLKRSTPVYQAHVQLLVELETPNVISFKDVVEQERPAADYYLTQSTMLRSRTLARKTIDALKLWKHPEFAGAAQAPPAAWSVLLDRGLASLGIESASPAPAPNPPGTEDVRQSKAINVLLRNLSVELNKNTRLIDINYRSTDPALATSVANALARAYIDQTLEVRFQVAKDATDWLETRLSVQREQVEKAEEAVQRYREQHDAVALQDNQNIVVQKLSDMNTAATRAKAARIEKQTIYEQLRSMQGDRAGLEVFPAVMSNVFIQQLKGQLSELQRQEAQLSSRLGDLHPDLIRARAAVQTGETKLSAELLKFVESARTDYIASQTQESSLIAELEVQKSQALALDRTAIDYKVLEREAETSRRVYESLLQRAKEMSISGALNTTNVRIVDPAEMPRDPVWPPKQRLMLVCMAIAALAAVGLSFVIEQFDKRIKSPESVRTHLSLPLLALVPEVPTRELAEGRSLINGLAPPQLIEAFGTLRAALLVPTANLPGVLLVASAGPGEGKTLVACNLAATLAQTGRRVLIVDLDLRRSRVHEILQLASEPGLAEALEGSVSAPDAVKRTHLPTLSALVAGRTSGNPGALLASARFRAVLGSLTEDYDYVILDSPPVLAVGDSIAFARDASAVVFVVNATKTDREAAQAALDRLESVGARFAGVVLNRVRIDRHPYYYAPYTRRGYRSYYQAS